MVALEILALTVEVQVLSQKLFRIGVTGSTTDFDSVGRGSNPLSEVRQYRYSEITEAM